MRRLLGVSAVFLALGLGSSAHAQTLPQTFVRRLAAAVNSGASATNYSGTVVDSAGGFVAGATVEYWDYGGTPAGASPLALLAQTTSAANGTFSVPISAANGFLLARKPGLAPGWLNLNRGGNAPSPGDDKLVLTPPGSLRGVVVDESSKPVADCVVYVSEAVVQGSREDGTSFVRFLTDRAASNCFSVRTDVSGHFHIDDFPTNALAILAADCAGRNLVQPLVDSPMDLESLGYRAGAEEIRFVLQPGGAVEGRVVLSGGETKLPLVNLVLQPEAPQLGSAIRTLQLPFGSDGTFRLANVASGTYTLRAIFGTNTLAVSDTLPDWVTEPVPVSLNVGETVRDVRVTAIRGGVLEVSVLGAADHKPLSAAYINVSGDNSRSGMAAQSDPNGIARLRLPPGNYQFIAYRQTPNSVTTSAQGAGSVESGRTNRVEIELAAPPPSRRVAGVVHTPDGRPAAGIRVRLINMFGGRNADNLTTDASGAFSLDPGPQQQLGGMNNSIPCLLARDVEHNLAAVQEIEEDDTNALDLKLEPALTLVMHAESDGKPLTNLTASLIFWTGNSGMWVQDLARTNVSGQCELPALPPGRKYGLVVGAPGYGQSQIMDVGASADPVRQELDTVELRPANLKLAGQVLDQDDKPVPGCYVNLNGNGQPNANVRTDRQGQFVFEHVCEGSVQLSANSRSTSGNVTVQAGDTNVVLRLGQQNVNTVGTRDLKGVVTDTNGQPAAGVEVAVFPNINGDGRWLKTRADGSYHVSWQPFNSSPGALALLVARDAGRSLAASEEIEDDATTLNLKLRPALTLAGQVKGSNDAPLPGAQIGIWLDAGNVMEDLDRQTRVAGADGRFEITGLPFGPRYTAYATAKGYGRAQQSIQIDPETNRVELAPIVLRPADQLIAGQVLDENDKPLSGVNIQVSGTDQPSESMVTDSKGRFHFQVCEGSVMLFANGQTGYAQVTVAAGDTNVAVTLSRQGNGNQTVSRSSLKGRPLPDLTTVNLPADAAPSGRPALLCLFDASQRPSRHAVNLLVQQAAALREKNISVLLVQAAITTDEAFNDWKTSGAAALPVGRLTEKSAKARWASEVEVLPWLILTDSKHKVIAEGFSLDDLDAQVMALPK